MFYEHCDVLTCDMVVRSTAQAYIVVNHYTKEPATGGCGKTHPEPKVKPSNKSGVPVHECMPSRQHPNKFKPVTQYW